MEPAKILVLLWLLGWTYFLKFGLLKHLIISDVHANYILFVYQAVHTICFYPIYEVEIIAEDELLVVESFNLFDYKPLSILSISLVFIYFSFLNVFNYLYFLCNRSDVINEIFICTMHIENLMQTLVYHAHYFIVCRAKLCVVHTKISAHYYLVCHLHVSDSVR